MKIELTIEVAVAVTVLAGSCCVTDEVDVRVVVAVDNVVVEVLMLVAVKVPTVKVRVAVTLGHIQSMLPAAQVIQTVFVTVVRGSRPPSNNMN